MVLLTAAVGGWVLTRPDHEAGARAAVASDPAGPDTKQAPGDELSETPASEPAEPAQIEPTEPTIRAFDDRVGDSRWRNQGAGSSGSADVSAVHVFSPTAASPGWVIVELRAATPGVGVILRIDADNDGWPDLTGWQHTVTGASGSFRVADWSHGSDILMRTDETDEHFDAGAKHPPRSGVAFALTFQPGELAGDRLRFNVQTVNDASYYDYFPRRQRWKDTSFEGAW